MRYHRISSIVGQQDVWRPSKTALRQTPVSPFGRRHFVRVAMLIRRYHARPSG